MFIHVRKPVTVYGEVEIDGKAQNSKKPCVSPFDLTYDATVSSAAC